MRDIRLFEKQREITRSDVEEALGAGITHAINTLKEMLDKELIKKIGNGRLTKYVEKCKRQTVHTYQV